MANPLPYKIAVLCYLFDADGRVLLLHRKKPPNEHLYSPVGGKLEQAIGESPTACALREIEEETGVKVHISDIHLTGIVSETAFNDTTHWLMFLYEVTCPANVTLKTFEEGSLEWHDKASIDALPIPDTDRYVIWPLFWKYRRRFFMVHINCTNGGIKWRVEQGDADEEKEFH